MLLHSMRMSEENVNPKKEGILLGRDPETMWGALCQVREAGGRRMPATRRQMRLVRQLDIAPTNYSAVVGSITLRTAATEFAGNPPCVACSRTMASFGAM